jgi:hypothetical protein
MVESRPSEEFLMDCSFRDSTKERGIDILIYVEDPGAANYVAGLPGALRDRGWRACLLADGPAYPHLLQLGIEPEMLHRSVTARELLSRFNPRLVLVGTSGNPDTFAFDLITEARESGIMTIGAVDAFGNADYRFRGRTASALSHAPERLAVADHWTKDAYISLGYPKECITVCGHPHYDRVREAAERLGQGDRKVLRRAMFPSNHEDAPVVIFGAEPLIGLNPGKYSLMPDYTLTGRGTRMNRTEIVLEEFLDAVAQLSSRPYLVLRMHPKNTKEELAAFLGDFNQVSDKGSSPELLFAADLVVGITSMLLQEAVIMGRPTLSIVPRVAEKKSLPMIRAGIITCVSTRDELRASLTDLLGKNSQSVTYGIDQFIHYGSLQRTVAFIEGILTDNLHSRANSFRKIKTYHG